MIGSRLKAIREKRGFSQRELAQRTNIAEKMIWRYENEQSEPSSGNLLKLVKELSVSADFLLGVVDEPGDHYSLKDLSELEHRLILFLRMTYGDYRDLGMGDHDILLSSFSDFTEIMSALVDKAKDRNEAILNTMFSEPDYNDLMNLEPPDDIPETDFSKLESPPPDDDYR